MRAQHLLMAVGLIGEAVGAALPEPFSADSSAPLDIQDLLRAPMEVEKRSTSTKNSCAPLNNAVINGVKYGCRCNPGDACWPRPSKWQQLNATVDGRLLVNIPPGAPCYDTFDGPLGSIPTRDEAACAALETNFLSEQWTVSNTTAGAISTSWTNDMCRPEGNPTNTCTLGNTGVYVISARTRAHVKAGIDFARSNNIRLLIRNTGHDLVGRSTGHGGLIINTHLLQDVNWISSFSGPGGYKGGAVKLGSGVQARDLLTKAHARNPPVVVVTGECPTVGIAGGFVQGGGHGPWVTLKGFSSDNVLEFEAVTASGDFVTANAKQNADLFWALKGGGPSTYAALISVTMKTFPDVKSAGAILYINGTNTEDIDLWWKGVDIIHKYSNHYVNNGLYAYIEVLAGHFLRARPFVAIDKTAAELQAILDPVLAELRAAGVPFDFTIKQFPTFFDLYLDMFEDEQAGGSMLAGGWLFNQEDVAQRHDQIVEAMKINMSPAPGVAAYQISHIFNPGYGMPVSNSATHPSWRNASNFIFTSLPVPVGSTPAEKARLQDILTNTMDEAFRRVSRSGATYIHEADPYQKNWGSAFWGSNYPLLQQIRRKWDPSGVFYAIATPGTERWEMLEGNTRLCKRL